MKKSLIFFVQLFVLLSIQSINLYSQKSDLQIEFSSEKTEYVIEEPVIINFSLTNIGNTKKEFKYGCSILGDIFSGLNLVNENDSNFRYTGPFIDCIGEKTLILKPDESVNADKNPISGYAVDLLFGYGFINTKNNLYDTYLPEGIYTISYKSKLSGEAVSSNEITIVIKKPEDKDSYNEFKEIDITNNDTLKYENFKKFLVKYPESCYKANIYNAFYTLSWLFKIYPEKIFEDLQIYIESNFNSWTIGKYVWSCSDTIKRTNGDAEWKKYLYTMITKYPGTKVSEAAFNLLFNIK